MISRYREGTVRAATNSAVGEREKDVQRGALMAHREATASLENWEFGRALDAIWGLVRRGNRYIDETQPWRLGRDAAQSDALDTVLATVAESLRFQGVLLAPFMPETADRILAQLGLPPPVPGAWNDLRWEAGSVDRTVPGGPPLFPRLSD